MKDDLLGEVLFHPDLTPKAVKRICEWIRDIKHKAEKWDAAVEWANSELDKIVDDEEPCVDVGVWCTAMRKELIICSDKLEAVMEWFIENGAFHCDVHDLIGLRKILEAKG